MPRPTVEECEALKKDIAENGLKVPVEFLLCGDPRGYLNWTVLDGVSRLDALNELGCYV
jgi:hypothetical protein